MAEEKLRWYALKIFYNRVFEMESLFNAMGLESYIAVELVHLKGDDHIRAQIILADPDNPRRGRYVAKGPELFERRPMVASLMFVHDTPEHVKLLNKELEGKGFVYRNAETRAAVAIPDRQMTTFRLVTDSGVTGLEFYADDDITRFRQGEKVRVVEGPLKGAEGYIKRIKRNRRLLVAIEGVIAVATSYIPPQFLAPVKE